MVFLIGFQLALKENNMSCKEAFFKANIQGIIALIVVIGGYGTILFGDVTQTDKNQIYMLMVMVLGFYFGNSKGSADKDKTISDSINKNDAT